MTVERLAEEIERLVSLLVREGGRLGETAGSQLTATQRLALGIAVDEGPLRLGALAERMGTTDATATRTVDALEAAGLVRREADPIDKRGVRVAATAEGTRTIAQRRQRLRELLGRLLGEQDLAHLAGLVAELNAHLAAGRRG